VRRRLTAAVALLSMVAATACKESPWTPVGSAELVLSEIKLGGAEKVSQRIDLDENFGRSVMNGIASGDSLWLQVAERLTPTSSAAEATLSIALASALPHSPDRVLALLGKKYPIEEVCGIPFLKADSLLVTSYHDEAIASLERVRSPTLTVARDVCRVTLDEGRDRRLERINPAYIVKNKPVAPRRPARKRPVKPRQTVTPQDTSSSD